MYVTARGQSLYCHSLLSTAGEKCKVLVKFVFLPSDCPMWSQSTGCLHSALELTSRFLSAHGQGLGQAGQLTIHTHKTLQMWSARLALLMHLRLYKEAELELHAFVEMLNPDLYYQYHTHSYPGKKGGLFSHMTVM